MEKIISRRNSKLIHAKELGKNRSYREKHGEFLCDGKKLLLEALQSEIQIVSVFISKELGINLPSNVNLYETQQDILESISPLKNPQDVIFTCKIPDQPKIDMCKGTHILLDNVQDPGNIGTVIRSADAFGIDSVILTGGSADPYNPKAIRASMGAIFRQQLVFTDIEKLQDIKTRFIGTAKDSEFIPVGQANLKDCVIILGNEGQGISSGLAALCGEMVTIPVAAQCESLNIAIAASIIMYEARGDVVDNAG